MNFTNILAITGLVLTGLGMITNVLDIGITLLIIGGIGSVIMSQIEISNL